MRLFNRSKPAEKTAVPLPSERPSPERPSPIRPRVLCLIHNPVVPSKGGRKLADVLGWQNPDRLAQQYIAEVQTASTGYANYEIVERVEVDGCPVKADGFAYTAEQYVRNWQARSGWHQPDGVDYGRLLAQFHIINRLNEDRIDEVWLFGFPYAGYYESIMVGPGAFWCNAPPIENRQARRRFVIMGFNYERGVGEMLENLGHRVESIMQHVYRGKRGQANLWERFIRHEKTHPGQAECGNVHFAPNSERDYDWGNSRTVQSRCDSWLQFPDLSGAARAVNCREWGNGDIRQHHLWWLRHLPHGYGRADGVSHNWWEYIINPNAG